MWGHKSAIEKDSGQEERERDGKSEGGLRRRQSNHLKAHLRALKLKPAGNISQRRQTGGPAARSISKRCCDKPSVSTLLCDITPDAHELFILLKGDLIAIYFI